MIQQLSLAICDAVYQVQQERPQLLNEKYRSLPLHETSQKRIVVDKLAQRLGKTTNSKELEHELAAIMRLLVQADVLDSAEYEHFFGHLPAFTPLLPTWNQATPAQPALPPVDQQTQADQQIQPEAIAILLLDAENLRIDDKIEAFLVNACTYPLRVKIAFANWRSLGQYDVELHNRHYDLIHVPKGDDMADGKMIVFGSSLHERYPEAKEVIVCSSDKVMSNLCTKLQQEGFLVSQVQKRETDITFSNTAGKIVNFSTRQASILPMEDYLAHVKQLIQEEQKQTGANWIPLTKISQQFRQMQGITLSQVMHFYHPGKKARDLFSDHPKMFVLHQAADNTELYVSLFDLHQPLSSNSVSTKEAKLHTTTGKTESALLSSKLSTNKQADPNRKVTVPHSTAIPPTVFHSRKELEAAIAKLVEDLLTNKGNETVDISKIGSQFSVHYGQPITEVLKQLQPPQKFVTFLKSCTFLIVEQKGQVWQVRSRVAKSLPEQKD